MSVNRTWILCRNFFNNKTALKAVGKQNLLKKTTRSYRVVGDHKINTMDDLPLPCTPWIELYAKKNSNYDKKLMIGALHFIFWFGIFIGTDIVSLNYNRPCFDLLDCRDKPKSK